MVLQKMVLVGAMIVALMVVAQNQRWGERARMVGVCAVTGPARRHPAAAGRLQRRAS